MGVCQHVCLCSTVNLVPWRPAEGTGCPRAELQMSVSCYVHARIKPVSSGGQPVITTTEQPLCPRVANHTPQNLYRALQATVLAKWSNTIALHSYISQCLGRYSWAFDSFWTNLCMWEGRSNSISCSCARQNPLENRMYTAGRHLYHTTTNVLFSWGTCCAKQLSQLSTQKTVRLFRQSEQWGRQVIQYYIGTITQVWLNRQTWH